MLKRESYEIRDQAHLMHAEGAQDKKPKEAEIIESIKSDGYIATEIDIQFDNMMGFWRWDCDIENI